MRKVGIAALALVAVAVIEIAVVVLVQSFIGLGWTLLLLLATTVLGGWLLRREGGRAWRRFREAAAAGRPPGGEVSSGFVGLLGALLLVVPGFVTDLVGLVLLVPPVRRISTRLAQRSAERRMTPAAAGQVFGPHRVRTRAGAPVSRSDTPAADGPDQVIEGEVLD